VGKVLKAGDIGIDVVPKLQEFGCQVVMIGCSADSAEAEYEFCITLTEQPGQGEYDGVVLAVLHKEYAAISVGNPRGYLAETVVLFDLKGVLPLGKADLRL